MADVTQILAAVESGDPRAADELLPLVYAELRTLAAAQMAREKAGQTLQATALVHEAYLRLVGGETHAMLAGAAGGWVQDVQFGGGVVGLSGLTKVLVGFGVGLSASRFQLTEPMARVMVLFGATLVDALIFERLAAAFDVRIQTLSLAGALTRAALNAALGGVLFFYVDRRLSRRRHA